MTSKQITPLTLLRYGFKTVNFNVFTIDVSHKETFNVDLLNKIAFSVRNVNKVTRLYPRTWDMDGIKDLFHIISRGHLKPTCITPLTNHILEYLGFKTTHTFGVKQLTDSHSGIMTIVSLPPQQPNITFQSFKESRDEVEGTILYNCDVTVEFLTDLYFSLIGKEIDSELTNECVVGFLRRFDFKRSRDNNFIWIRAFNDHNIVYSHETRTISMYKESELVMTQLALNIQTEFIDFYNKCQEKNRNGKN